MMKIRKVLNLILIGLLLPLSLFAREIEYKDSEVTTFVTPGEPTRISFEAEIKSGFKRTGSPLSVKIDNSNMTVFAQEELTTNGEALLVTLVNERTYSLRIKPSDPNNPRDDIVTIVDGGGFGAIMPKEEADIRYSTDKYPEAQPNSVSGLMKELVLAMEFGKNKIPGYRASDQYAGEVLMDDGALLVTIEKIFIGGENWGYVLNAQNQLDSNQQINPGAFRVAGTRAISATRWELAPRPITAEQQLAGKDRARVYVITRAQ